MKLILTCFFLFALASQLVGKEVTVSSAFNPQQVFANETASLQISVETVHGNTGFFGSSGSDIEFESMPAIQGLEVHYQGPMRRTSITNGHAVSSVVFQFAARAAEPGSYTLPAFTIKVDGRTEQVPEATLEVMEQGTTTDTDGDEARIGWMDIVFPREHIYAYESIPFQVRLYLREDQNGRRMQDFPAKEGDGFTVSPFSSPVMRMANIDGVNYYVMIWQAVLTPLKAGENKLEFTYDMLLVDRNARRSTGISDPFFNSLFGGSMMVHQGNTRQLSFTTGEDTLDILELPTEGKPGTFSGAIGAFASSGISVDPKTAQVGEPVELEFTFAGEGNFQYMDAPALAATDGWRLRGTDKDFEPADRYEYRGKMTYRYILSAESDEVTETPGITFSYFDPKTESYVTDEIAPVPIAITPAPPGMRRTAADEHSPQADQRGLIGLRDTPGRWVGSMQPIFTSPLFLGAQVIPLTALLCLFFTRRHQNRLLTDKQYARVRASRRALKVWLEKANAASGRQDAVAFYAAAQRAVQESLGHLVEQEPASLSADEIERLLGQHGADAESLALTRDFLNAGDALKFGGLFQGGLDLKREQQQLESLCNANLKLS